MVETGTLKTATTRIRRLLTTKTRHICMEVWMMGPYERKGTLTKRKT